MINILSIAKKASLAIICALLVSCAANESGKAASGTLSETAASTAAAQDDPTAAMCDRSLYSLGNTHRLKQKIEKARNGEDITIAYIGGSITEGLTAGKEACYAALSAELFEESFANGGSVRCVNAGLSGTPSNLGVLRLERDVLSSSPDMIFVEFAVNDSQDKLAKESYESLVKTALGAEGEPAVILLFNVIESGYTAQEHMKEIGSFYELPMISAADALTEEFESGRMSWEDYSDDSSHPNAEGHRLLCKFIGNLFKKADAAPDSGEYTLPAGSIYSAPYENAVMITPSDTQKDGIEISQTGAFVPMSGGASGFNEAWKYDGTDAPMKLSVNANAFFVIYKRGSSDNYGSFDVYLNGERLKTVNTCQSDGWGEAYSEQIIKFQSVREMELEIRPSEENGQRDIQILGFAFSENTAF